MKDWKWWDALKFSLRKYTNKLKTYSSILDQICFE